MADVQPWEQYQPQPPTAANDTPWAKYGGTADAPAPAEKPSMLDRAWKATGLPDTARGLVKGFGDDGDWDPGTIVHNAVKMLGGSLEQSGEFSKDAMRDAAMGHFGSAAGGFIASTPFVGPMIDKFATHVENGEWPEAAGTALMLFGPKLLGEAAPVVTKAAKSVAEVPSRVATATQDLGVGAKAFAAKPPAGQSVPGTAGMSPEVMDVLALHPKVAVAGSIAKRFANAIDAMDAAKGARLPAQGPEGGWGFREPVEPAGVQLTPQQQAIAQAHATARQAPALAAPVALNVGDLMDPATLQQAIQERFAANRAARQRADPQSADSVVARLKAMGDQPTLTEVAKAPAKYADTPHDLSSQLKQHLDRLRAADPDFEGPPEPPAPDYADSWQKSLDALKAKGKAVIQDTSGSLNLGDVVRKLKETGAEDSGKMGDMDEEPIINVDRKAATQRDADYKQQRSDAKEHYRTEIKKAVEPLLDGDDYVGVRLQSRNEVRTKPGDSLRPSSEWIDEVKTRNKLPGTAGFHIESMADVDKVIDALDRHNYLPSKGERLSIIKGDYIDKADMPESRAVAFRNAKLQSILPDPKGKQ